MIGTRGGEGLLATFLLKFFHNSLQHLSASGLCAETEYCTRKLSPKIEVSKV